MVILQYDRSFFGGRLENHIFLPFQSSLDGKINVGRMSSWSCFVERHSELDTVNDVKFLLRRAMLVVRMLTPQRGYLYCCCCRNYLHPPDFGNGRVCEFISRNGVGTYTRLREYVIRHSMHTVNRFDQNQARAGFSV
jgi:hypothetical protein